MPLPESGSVLGIDIGCSPKRRSSAICRIDWRGDALTWSIKRFRADEEERRATISELADRPCLAAAFDGPLRSDLDVIGRYRLAERMLTVGLASAIGKPGQASAPIGKLLNHNANLCARAVLELGIVDDARHRLAIHRTAIVEAFPTSFLGVMIAEPEGLNARRGDRSDVFYTHLVTTGVMQVLIGRLLPGRRLADLSSVTNHDDRAGLICALTALCIAADDYTAVGDRDNGWIIMPPADMVQPWARHVLRRNDASFGGFFSSFNYN